MDRRVLTMVLVSSAALLPGGMAVAGCITGYTPPPVVDPNFRPISMRFDVHVTSKFDGAGDPTTVDQSFSQDITIDRSLGEQSNFCSSLNWIDATPGSTASANTTDISNHAGSDFSLVPARAELESHDTGWVTKVFPSGVSISYPTYELTFSISAEDSVSIPTDDPMRTQYANYDRLISLHDSGLEGDYWNQPLDLTAYLQSHVGSTGFYRDLVSITADHLTWDWYGYEGTVTLAKVTVVPEPEAAEMVALGLVMLCGVARRGRNAPG